MGTIIQGKPTYVTLGNVGVMAFRPGVMYCGSHKNHFTNQGVKENMTFSINYPSADMIEVTDYCGMVSGRTVDKSVLFTNFYGVLRTAPMIQECPVNLECKVINILEINDNEVFIGEVVETYLSQHITPQDTTKWPDLSLVNPLIFNIDYQYWKIGKFVAREGCSRTPRSHNKSNKSNRSSKD
jgi:flavin reductase (DIM6/NTAB) family NADH-FMN oxidoreductase RutF